MTLRKCILLQSHLESFVQIVADDPDLNQLAPNLEKLLEEIRIVRLKLIKAAMSNVIPFSQPAARPPYVSAKNGDLSCS